MSVTETVLFLVIVPLAIALIIGGLAYIGGARRDTRYRPGRPYQFSPVWYVANHRRAGTGERELTAGEQRAALPAGRSDQPGPGGLGTVGQGASQSTGGASDRW